MHPDKSIKAKLDLIIDCLLFKLFLFNPYICKDASSLFITKPPSGRSLYISVIKFVTFPTKLSKSFVSVENSQI